MGHAYTRHIAAVAAFLLSAHTEAYPQTAAGMADQEKPAVSASAHSVPRYGGLAMTQPRSFFFQRSMSDTVR